MPASDELTRPIYVLRDSVQIASPLDRCFLLSTSIDLVAHTLGMKPVGGQTSGLITGASRVEWRGWKFGLRQRHETVITEYDRPNCFQDSMASGRFRTFQHDHEFVQVGDETLLKDVVRFSMPFGLAGKLVGKYVLAPHIRALMRRRFALLKRVAESEEWRRYLPAPEET
jgi:ligand-binding SRPBCC domain-containing protein